MAAPAGANKLRHDGNPKPLKEKVVSTNKIEKMSLLQAARRRLRKPRADQSRQRGSAAARTPLIQQAPQLAGLPHRQLQIKLVAAAPIVGLQHGPELAAAKEGCKGGHNHGRCQLRMHPGQTPSCTAWLQAAVPCAAAGCLALAQQQAPNLSRLTSRSGAGTLVRPPPAPGPGRQCARLAWPSLHGRS